MTKEERRKKLALTPEDNKSLIVLAYMAALIGLGLGLLMVMHSDLRTRFLTYIHARVRPCSTADSGAVRSKRLTHCDKLVVRHSGGACLAR